MRIAKINNYDKIIDKELKVLPEIELSKPTYTFYDEKGRNKFIKKIEKIVRSSLEYRELINYLRSSLGMNYCMFFENVSTDKHAGIEIHHIPFSLFDIVSIVLKKYEVEELELDPLTISEEVMSLHYKGHVGLVPLSITVHELYHRGDIFIPLQYVDKGFFIFFKEYKEYMDDYVEMLEKLIEMSKKYEFNAPNILKKHLIYLDNVEYLNTPERIKK